MVIECIGAAICPKCKEVPVMFKGEFTRRIHCTNYCNVIKKASNRLDCMYSKNEIITYGNDMTNQELINCWNNSI